jgi:hypothetical protein
MPSYLDQKFGVSGKVALVTGSSQGLGTVRLSLLVAALTVVGMLGCQSSFPTGDRFLRTVTLERIMTGMTGGTAYLVSLDSSGRVELEYRGSSRKIPKGTKTVKRIDPQQAALVFAKLEEIDFWHLKDSYRTIEKEGITMFATDLPTQIVTATRDGISKRVDDYYGTPEGLRELEALIDQAADVDQWLKQLGSRR